MGKFALFFLVAALLSHECQAQILEFQQKLVADGTTGSNVFQLYKSGEIVYNKAVNSGAVGDADISDSTIFAIHSMTKTVTTVAMMILQGSTSSIGKEHQNNDAGIY